MGIHVHLHVAAKAPFVCLANMYMHRRQRADEEGRRADEGGRAAWNRCQVVRPEGRKWMLAARGTQLYSVIVFRQGYSYFVKLSSFSLFSESPSAVGLAAGASPAIRSTNTSTYMQYFVDVGSTVLARPDGVRGTGGPGGGPAFLCVANAWKRAGKHEEMQAKPRCVTRPE